MFKKNRWNETACQVGGISAKIRLDVYNRPTEKCSLVINWMITNNKARKKDNW